MKGSKYLSELVDCSAFQKGKINIIKAPTGSGKTYFALQHIPSLTHNAIHEVVYLIDTINGKDQLIRNYNAVSEYYGWSKEVETGGMWFDASNHVVVLTYAKFGLLCGKYSGFYKKFSYIICDELHSLLKFQHFSPQPNCHSVARGALELAVKEGSTTVIALTATPDSLYTGFNAPAVEMPIDQQEIKRYEVKETAEYTNAYSVLDRVEVGSVGLCYFSRINTMKEFCGKAEKMGFSPICVWSINNIDHTMTDEQLEVRRSILEDWVIPPRYDLLIINSSSETSLKIKSPVDYVMVHSSNPDTQIQVRGRVNGDIQTLYLPTEGVPEVKVPDEFLGIRLFTAQKRDLITKLNLRNANNRLRGWPTVKEILIDNDYCITEDRYRSQYYAIITRPSDG